MRRTSEEKEKDKRRTRDEQEKNKRREREDVAKLEIESVKTEEGLFGIVDERFCLVDSN
jgi:hypothetical protein